MRSKNMTTFRTSTPTSSRAETRNRRCSFRPGGGSGMRVFGIDCGTERTGYGVIESDGRLHRIVSAGCIPSSPGDPRELRLLHIAGELRRLLAEHRPDSAAIEEVFFAVNAKSALK